MPFSFCSKPRPAFPCQDSKPRPCLRFYFPAPNAFSPILFSHISCNKRPPPFLSAFLFNARAFGTLHIPVKGLSYPAEFLCGVGRSLFFSALSPRRNALLHFYVFSLSLTVCRIPSVFCIALLCFHPLKFSHSIFCSLLYPLHTYNLFVPLYLPPQPRLLNPIRRPARFIRHWQSSRFPVFRPINAKLCPFLFSLPLLSPPAFFSLSYSVNHTAFQPSAFSLL